MLRRRVVMLVLAIGWSCSDRAVKEKVDKEALCEERCGWLLDPTCGAEDPVYESEAECVGDCVPEDGSGYAWGECTDLRIAYYDCLRALTCVERRVHFTNVLNSECYAEQDELLHCSAEVHGVES